MQDNYKGFSLFNDITDTPLRNRNRAVVLANIAENNCDRSTKRINQKGAGLILNYFLLLPDCDKADVNDRFVVHMKERGFALQRQPASV